MSRSPRATFCAAFVVMLCASTAQGTRHRLTQAKPAFTKVKRVRFAKIRPVNKMVPMSSARGANFYRKSALEASGIPKEFHKQTRVRALGQTPGRKPRTIFAVVPRLNEEQVQSVQSLKQVPRPARVVSFMVGRENAAGKARVRGLSQQERQAVGLIDAREASRQAAYMDGQIFGSTRYPRELHSAGGSSRGVSHRFVENVKQTAYSFCNRYMHRMPAGSTIQRYVPFHEPRLKHWRDHRGQTAVYGPGYDAWPFKGKEPALWQVLAGEAKVVPNTPKTPKTP